MRIASAIFLLFLLACGEEDPIVQRVRPPEARRAAAAVAERTGTVHEVQMVGSMELGFRFEPADLRVKVGDTVRWVNGSGLPHNVAFYADSIPQGALVVIEAIMPAEGKLGPMNGRIVSELGDVFEMDFENAPLGVYHYFSVVQESLGMVGTLTFEQ
jgi:plastocyanin